MAHDVFISHSVKDKATADAVCAMLESAGIRCWIAPRDVMPGMEWSECIIEAIEQTRVMVLVFTADANASPQIRREVERAVNHGVAILPVRIEDVMPGRALEYFIGNVHWLDALTPPLEAHLKNLAGTVKMLLARMDQNPSPMPHTAAGRVPHATKLPEPAVVPAAEPAMPPLPENGHDESGFRGDGADEKPFEIGKAASIHTQGGSPTRTFGEWQSGGGTVAKGAPLLRIPVWVWGGAALALLLAAVLAAVHFTSHPAPAASPEPVTPPAQAGAPNPASTISPAGVPERPASVPKTGPAKTASPVTPGSSVSAGPAAMAPETAPDNAALLRDAMSTIQTELNGIGTVTYKVFITGMTPPSVNETQEFSNVQVSVSEGRCEISYHFARLGNNGQPLRSEDDVIPLGDITDIVAQPYEQFQNQHSQYLQSLAPQGPKYLSIASVAPPITAVHLLRPAPHDWDGVFVFSDAVLADRFAKNLRAAVRLCRDTAAN